jgi:ubiquinone/menaquinone biosynthesis C-methylase UbiE
LRAPSNQHKRQKIAGGNELIDAHALLVGIELSDGEIVGDFGCGSSGHFALQAAKMVGRAGRVYAVDIRKTALRNVESRARIEGLHNIVPVWTNLERYGAAKIAERRVEVGLLINILFQTQQHEAIIREVDRMMKPGGRIAVVDWAQHDVPFGPPEPMKVTLESVLTLAQKVNWTQEKVLHPGPYHFGVLFRKPDRLA